MSKRRLSWAGFLGLGAFVLSELDRASCCGPNQGGKANNPFLLLAVDLAQNLFRFVVVSGSELYDTQRITSSSLTKDFKACMGVFEGFLADKGWKSSISNFFFSLFAFARMQAKRLVWSQSLRAFAFAIVRRLRRFKLSGIKLSCPASWSIISQISQGLSDPLSSSLPVPR